MTQISELLAEIINLHSAAVYHKAVCDTPYCGTSIHLMRQTARRLLREIRKTTEDDYEISEAERYLKDWPK